MPIQNKNNNDDNHTIMKTIKNKNKQNGNCF